MVEKKNTIENWKQTMVATCNLYYVLSLYIHSYTKLRFIFFSKLNIDVTCSFLKKKKIDWIGLSINQLNNIEFFNLQSNPIKRLIWQKLDWFELDWIGS